MIKPQSPDKPVRGRDHTPTASLLGPGEGFPTSVVPLLHCSYEYSAGEIISGKKFSLVLILLLLSTPPQPTPPATS